MAFGFSPKYSVDFPIEGLTNEQFLTIAITAAKENGWNVGYTSETGFVAYTKFSMSSYSEEVKLKIDNGIAIIKSECTGSQIFDWGKNKRNVENFLADYDELRNKLTPEEIIQKTEELKPSMVPASEDILSLPPSATKENFGGLVSIFKPTNNFFITPILVDLNIIVFILMVITGVNAFSPDSESLLKWGANFRPVTLNGEWWRLITNFFLHIGIVHLLFNMYALVYIGLLLEPYLGKLRFATAYFFTGVIASLASLWWHDLTISAGASGAIFGMYGVFLSMLTTNLIEKSARKALLTSIGIFVGYNLLNGMKGNVDNAAHLGGLCSGLLIGYAYFPSLKKPDDPDLQYKTVALVSALAIIFSVIFYNKVPRDMGKYFEKMETFAILEKQALSLYSISKNASKEELTTSLKSGLHYWNESVKLINEAEKLNIPAALHTRNQQLLHYCDLRIKSFELISKEVTEDSNQYDDQIKDYNDQIERVVESLEKK
jgi:rhomboid protease GluP